MNVTVASRGSWIRPTIRAIDWTPLALVTAVILAAEGVIASTGVDPPVSVVYTGLSGLAASAVLGLGDSAQALLQPVPASAHTRLLHRTALLGASTVLSVCAIAVAAYLFDVLPHLGLELVESVVALVAVGIAVHAVAGTEACRRHEIAATTVLLWVATAALPMPAAFDVVRLAWLERPGWVAIVAVTTTIGAANRRAA